MGIVLIGVFVFLSFFCTNSFFLQFSAKSRKKNTKSPISQKLWIAQKNSWCKNSNRNNALLLFFEKKWPITLRRKNLSNYISKTEKSTKKIHYGNNERQVNFDLPCIFGNFRRKLNFCAPKIAPFGRPWPPNAIWCDTKFCAHHFLKLIAHLLW